MEGMKEERSKKRKDRTGERRLRRGDRKKTKGESDERTAINGKKKNIRRKEARKFEGKKIIKL